MKLECPCKDCVAPKRTATCHQTCEDYKKWVKKHLISKALIEENKRKENLI